MSARTGSKSKSKMVAISKKATTFDRIDKRTRAKLGSILYQKVFDPSRDVHQSSDNMHPDASSFLCFDETDSLQHEETVPKVESYSYSLEVPVRRETKN